jgi:hypothetical protein
MTTSSNILGHRQISSFKSGNSCISVGGGGGGGGGGEEKERKAFREVLIFNSTRKTVYDGAYAKAVFSLSVRDREISC